MSGQELNNTGLSEWRNSLHHPLTTELSYQHPNHWLFYINTILISFKLPRFPICQLRIFWFSRIYDHIKPGLQDKYFLVAPNNSIYWGIVNRRPQSVGKWAHYGHWILCMANYQITSYTEIFIAFRNYWSYLHKRRKLDAWMWWRPKREPASKGSFSALGGHPCAWRIPNQAAIGVWNRPRQCESQVELLNSAKVGGPFPAASLGVFRFSAWWTRWAL